MDTGSTSTVFFWTMLLLSFASKHKRTSDEVARRRRVTHDWPDPTDACCICLDAYVPGRYARTARCGHAFHAACFTRLVRTATQCPLCRVALDGPSLLGGEPAARV